MKKTIDLLNEAVAMGFSRERALSDIVNTCQMWYCRITR